jgi:chitodextrinase
VRATAITIVLLLLTACTDSGALTDPSPVESTTSSGLTIKNVRARSGNLYEIANEGLQVGAKRFTDRGFRFEAPVPSRLRGLPFIRTAFNDRDANPDERSFLSFEVNRNVTVYVVHDDTDPVPAWLRGGFDDTGLDLHDNSPHGGSLSVHRAWFPAGTVTLGSAASGDASPVSMYTVLIEGQGGGNDLSAPTAPTGLTATATSASTIALEWSASSDDVGVAGYHVYRGGNQVADVSGPGYTDTGLTAGTEYTYTVAAYDAAGNVSSESAPAGATTEGGADTQPPSVPTGLAANAVSTSAIDLSWSASGDDVGVAGYFVYRDGNLVRDVSGTTLRDEGLEAGTEYVYTVAAYDAAGNVSQESASATATTTAQDTQAPTVPTDLTATAVTSVAIDLSWSASQDDVGVAGYFVYRDGTQVGDVTETTYHDTGLEIDTEYTYTVAAYDAAGNVSDLSSAASATTITPDDREAPSIPTGLSATTASTSSIDLAWNASQDNVGVVGYYVYRGNTRVADVSGTTFRDSGLEAGQSYLYTVAAYDAAGNRSNRSASATATTGTEEDTEAPSAPTNLSASPASSSAIDLSWSASQDDVGVAGYYIYRGGTRVADVSDTSYRDGGLAASTSYTYTVAAYDAAGNVSDESGSAGATTDSEGGGSGGGLISNVQARSGRFYQVVPTGFVAGRARYTDRDYTFQAPLPQSLQGLTYIRTANADKGAAPSDASFLTFDAARDVTVYVAHDDRAAVPAWLGDRFTDTGMDIRDSDALSGTFSVYSAGFAAGRVTLGSNVATAGTQISMYSVIVREGAGSGGGDDTQAPSIPTTLRATAASSSAIDLSWDASSDDVGVAGYYVYRGNTRVAEVSGTSFRDTGLEPATTYLYTVAAYDAAGNVSNRSASASATTQSDGDTQTPSVPTDLTATTVSSSAIDLSWSASSDDVGVAGYYVYRTPGDIRVGDVSGTEFGDTDLEAGTTYGYKVAAYDAAGNVSERSAAASATTDDGADTQAPTVPTNLGATAASSSAIDLSWNASSDDVGVAGYYVYRGGAQVGDVSGTSYRDGGLAASTRYTYTVAAYDAAGNVSNRSASASATTGSDGEASSGRLYEVWERAVENGKSYGNPYDFRQIELRATFEAPSGRTYDWFGFHDGNGSGGDNGTVWKLRFAPDEVGTWSYTYRWSDGTTGGSGTISVSDGGAPGPLRVASDRSWFLENARGRAFDARGYSLHQYLEGKYGRTRFGPSHVDDLIDKIGRKVADRNYNLLMMLWPMHTVRAGHHFWQGTDFTRFDVSVWALLEDAIEAAAARRVYVFPFAGLVDQDSARPTSDDQLRVYLRYLAARLGCYWNLFGYSLTWEYHDILDDRRADWIMGTLHDDLSRLPVPPLLSIHDHSDNTFRDWLDFSMRQQQSRSVFDGNLHGGGKQGGVGSAFLDAPILGSEDIWEYQNGDFGQPRNGTEVRRGAWGIQMAGVMPIYSETGLSAARAPAGGQSNFSGEGERYVRLMYDFVFANTRYRRYQMLNGRVSASQRQIASGIPGREYLVYDENGGSVAIDLSGDGGLTFQATWFNPVTGASTSAGSVAGGSTVSLTSPWSGDSVLLLRR